jgi:hypothetical protein
LDAPEVEALAAAVVERAKNIRPVMSAMITIKVFGMIVQFHEPVPGRGQPCRGRSQFIFHSFYLLYGTLIEKEIRRTLECWEDGTELIGPNT